MSLSPVAAVLIWTLPLAAAPSSHLKGPVRPVGQPGGPTRRRGDRVRRRVVGPPTLGLTAGVLLARRVEPDGPDGEAPSGVAPAPQPA
jgi:hypothetical protein